MRAESGYDQAEGLRRLLLRNQAQVVTLVAGKAGVGRTSATLHLAAALARSGKKVLVLDENPTPHNLLERLHLKARYDLLDVVQDLCPARAALLSAQGFRVLSAARVINALGSFDEAEQQRLEMALTELSEGVEVLLVDAAMLVGHAVSTSLASAAQVVVVMDATVSGITESYALIKRLALQNARVQFGILVNKVADQAAAQTVFNNMAKVARSHLAARLDFLGFVPQDERLQRATLLGKTVLEAFPNAPSAQAYAGVAQGLLRCARHDEASADGVSSMMRKLVRQLHRQAHPTDALLVSG